MPSNSFIKQLCCMRTSMLCLNKLSHCWFTLTPHGIDQKRPFTCEISQTKSSLISCHSTDYSHWNMTLTLQGNLAAIGTGISSVSGSDANVLATLPTHAGIVQVVGIMWNVMTSFGSTATRKTERERTRWAGVSSGDSCMAEHLVNLHQSPCG